MTKITLHPNVANFIVRMDWNDSRGDLPGFSEELVRNYEAGKLILLGNAPFTIDFPLLNQVSLPEDSGVQKLSDKFLVYPKLYKPRVAKFMFENFAGRPLLYARFRREVRSVSGQIRSFLGSMFRGYRFARRGVSWRFTRTGPESLHLDFFKPKGDFDYLRLFINIDEEPRVWSVTHQLEELVARTWESARLIDLMGAPPHVLTQHINNHLLYGLSHRPPEETDRHVIEFAQGDVWLCESRTTPHQIISGRRMIATDFYVDPSSMRDPSRRVVARVERCMQACAERATMAGAA